ncbi:hypothetical protein KC19_6G065300 [Ceratodon purpureus]|uniref:Uncharacterized protein n=1 Tax=Ceratodon purpureus TaxID=3225 RepID=A0A8T0HF55_CERPU|nr:hypothetical protein KC19_6G065300 [Ceratodon purpureus]
MAFGVHQKVSHDISLAFGKGLQGLKVEAMGNQGKLNNNSQRKGFSGRTLMESIMLGVLTITVAAIPVVVTHVPAPESLIIIKEILQDWCTPSVCFGILIIGILIVTLGGGGSEPPSTPEQNHKKFADSYLTQGPVSATQIDPLRMPDIFFSPDAARTHALNHSASFPVRAAQPSSVMVPVYYPAFVPPQQHSPFSSHSEKDVDFLLRHEGQFESNVGDRFVPRMDERFVSRVGDRFPPRVDDRYSPRVEERFGPRLEEWFSPKVEDRFGPRVDERFSPRVEERFGPKVEDRFGPRVDERFSPRVEERFGAKVDERYVPRDEERYVPQVEERYVPEVEERYVPQVEERYESQEHDRFEAEDEDTYEHEEEVRYGAHVESRARSDSEDEGRYVHHEDAESDREDEVEHEQHRARYIASDSDDEGEAEPDQVEMQSGSEDEVEHHSHESHVQQPPLLSESIDSSRKVISPPHSPVAPPAVEVASVHTQLPPPQRQSYSASSTGAPEAGASSNLLSRRRPPTVPTPVVVQPPPPPPPLSEPIATSSPEPKMSPPEPKMSVRVERKEAPEMSPPEPKMSVRVERKETPEMSPRTPPKHSNQRRPLSSTSRSYGEYVRQTTDCPLPNPKTPSPSTRSKLDASAVAPVGVLPKVGSSPSPKTEASETSLDEKLARMKARNRRQSTGSISLVNQALMPNKKPREVRVVDDDKLDKELAQDPAEEDDDVDQRVEAFLKNFREQMRLQRQESLQRHRRSDIKP